MFETSSLGVVALTTRSEDKARGSCVRVFDALGLGVVALVAQSMDKVGVGCVRLC